MTPPNMRLRTRHKRASLLSCVGAAEAQALGDGTKTMAAVEIGLAAVAVLVSQSLLYE
jgi:hypothetical protein